MATFTLRAVPACMCRTAGATIIKAQAFDSLGEPGQVAANSVPGLADAVARFGAGIAAAYPGRSFQVAVLIARGERKPNGFDAARRHGALGTDAWLQNQDGLAADLLAVV